jgi:Na+-driven multidrug efflux pump
LGYSQGWRKVEDKNEFMGKDPIWPLLLRFSGPSIISATVTATYNLVDAISAGCLGLEALAALAVAFPLMIIYTSIGFCVGFGSSSLISRNLGARRRRAADIAVGNAIFLFLLISIIATLVFYLSLERRYCPFGWHHPLASFRWLCLRFCSASTVLPSNLALALVKE